MKLLQEVLQPISLPYDSRGITARNVVRLKLRVLVGSVVLAGLNSLISVRCDRLDGIVMLACVCQKVKVVILWHLT